MNKAIEHTEWLIHLLLIAMGWLMMNFFMGDIRIGIFQTNNGGFIWPSLYGTALNSLLFYGNTEWLIPKVLRKKGIANYTLWLLFFFASANAVEALVDQWFASIQGIELDKGSMQEIVLLVVITHVLTLIASFAYRFSKDWFYNERIKHDLIATNLQTELDFLRSQVNPHFLFNTLNNLFSMAIKSGDDATAEGIGRLSGLMRYMLYDSNQTQISLRQEIDYLHDYIALQELRVVGREDVEISLTIHGKAGSQKLSPMLLIPFVENAFKYGLSPSQPVSISFHFELSEKQLIFESRNTINRNSQSTDKQASGIGLENIKRRLGLLYPERHELLITENEEVFEVRLLLDIAYS